MNNRGRPKNSLTKKEKYELKIHHPVTDEVLYSEKFCRAVECCQKYSMNNKTFFKYIKPENHDLCRKKKGFIIYRI